MDTFRSCGNPVTKLQTLAVLWTLFFGSFDPQKKVRIELLMVAVLWPLFKTAIYGRCFQVYNHLNGFDKENYRQVKHKKYKNDNLANR